MWKTDGNNPTKPGQGSPQPLETHMIRYIIQHEKLVFNTISPTGRTVWTNLTEDTGGIAVFLNESEAREAVEYIKANSGLEPEVVKIEFPG